MAREPGREAARPPRALTAGAEGPATAPGAMDTTETPAPEPRAPRLTRQTRLDLLAGGLVLLAYALVQLWLLLGPHPYDPAYYFKTALEFPIARADYWTLRIGLMAPVSLAVRLLGPSEAAFYAVPLAVGLLLTGAVYGTMLALFRDRVAGAAAALVTVLNPSYLLNSSFIFPDTAATATFTAGILFLVLGRARPEEGDRGWIAPACALAAGAFFGWSYLIRELSPILLPAVVAALVLLRYPLRRVGLVLGAAVVTFSLELLYGAVGYGDAFVRAHVLLDRRDAQVRPARERLMELIHERIDDPLDALLVFPRLLLTWDVGWILLALLAIFLAGLAVFRRDRHLWLLAAWLLSFWAVMAVFGLWTLPSGELIVNVTNVRYWYPILPPLAMGAFGSLHLLLGKASASRRSTLLAHGATAALGLLVLLPSTVEFRDCARQDLWRNEPAAPWDELRSWFASPDAEPYDVVWADRISSRIVPVYIRTTFGERVWGGEVRPIPRDAATVVPAPERDGALVLFHTRWGHRGVDELRREWSPVFRSEDGRLVLLADDGETPATGPAWWQTRAKAPTRGELGECGLGPIEGNA